MPKKQYHQHKKHYRLFSLYYSELVSKEGSEVPFTLMVVASKKGVHPHAVERNFAKRRLRACLKNYFKQHSLPAITLKIVAKKEILNCKFAELETMLRESLQALSL